MSGGPQYQTAPPGDVVAFWRAAGPDLWFAENPAFDTEIRARFLWTYEVAAGGGQAVWEEAPESTLALLIVLDQFSRNIFRGLARAFATDPHARMVANGALARGFDQGVERLLRIFFYLPFEHAETMADQERSLALFRAYGDPDHLKYAEEHADVIRQFGRFPWRNIALGRTSTPAEIKYLRDHGYPT